MPSDNSTRPAFLVGIDLEPLPYTDQRDPVGWDDLTTLTHVILEVLRNHGWKATFFTVGLVAERRPSLLTDVLAEGHEIACHTHSHRRVDELSAEDFHRDLQTNLEVLYKAGANAITGFRAPFFSLTETGAAEMYESMHRAGIRYSSSVSDSRNLPDWVERATVIAESVGVTELGVSSLWPAPMGMPVGIPLGGLYWRSCPKALLIPRVRRIAGRQSYLSSFFHPHDFYSAGTRYIDWGLVARNPLFAALLAIGRRSVEPKLEEIATMGFEFLSFEEYLERGAASRARVDRAAPRAPSPRR